MSDTPAPPTACADCGGDLVPGTLVDYRRNRAEPGEWVPGEVESSVWTGALRNAERLEVQALRCTRCGLLRLYATERARRPGNTSTW